MKRIRQVTAWILTLTLVVLLCASCTSNDQKLYDKIYAHLNEQYKGVEFRINGYTQDIQTSGKYTFDVTCLTTDIDFEVIMSSLLISDSYFVTHANERLKNSLFEQIGSARSLICLADVQCFNHYREEGNGYRFNEDEELTSFGLTDLTSIYRVTLDGIESSGDAAQCVYMFCDILDSKGIHLDEVTFSFVLNEEPILFTTDTDTIEQLESFEPLEDLFEKAKSPSALDAIFYRDPDSNTKIITYVTD